MSALDNLIDTFGEELPYLSRLEDLARAELDALRQRVSDLEAKLKSDAVLTPRKCVTCDGQRMAEEMREACADAVRKLSRMNSAYEDVIRAIPLPVCNPLAPSQSDLDMLAAWHERM